MKYVASSKSQMTDYTKYYVYTGHEEGMVTGCWYFWSGTEWLIGGDYQCGIDDIIETSADLDTEGMPADAKAVGDMIVVSETEPTSPYNELWIDPDTESVLVPTMDDLDSLYVDIMKNKYVDDWAVFKNLVGRGVAKDLFPVGSTISEMWYKTEQLSYSAPWDIVHYDTDGNVYLQQHYTFPTGVAFDAPEAIYYATEIIPAGQYYITIGLNYGSGWHAGDHINITTTEAMAVGDQLVISTDKTNTNDPTDGRTWTIYAKGSTTPKDSGITSNSAVGIEIGSTSTNGTGYTNGQVNAPQRVVYGYNRWSQSSIRQYLNSASVAGSWWIPMNDWDRPPAEATTVRGWLAGWPDEFLDILEPVDVETMINASNSEITNDRVFLPSLKQMYFSPEVENVEGDDWDYYKELAAEIGMSGQFDRFHNYDIIKRYVVDNTTISVGIWLRSAFTGSSSAPWNISNSGNAGNGGAAYNTYRGCPACIIGG